MQNGETTKSASEKNQNSSGEQSKIDIWNPNHPATKALIDSIDKPIDFKAAEERLKRMGLL